MDVKQRLLEAAKTTDGVETCSWEEIMAALEAGSDDIIATVDWILESGELLRQELILDALLTQGRLRYFNPRGHEKWPAGTDLPLVSGLPGRVAEGPRLESMALDAFKRLFLDGGGIALIPNALPPED
ncbi:MAG: hypothetical protein VKP72_10060 [bacterium]|nr:hypothetical protein [bacterium]